MPVSSSSSSCCSVRPAVVVPLLALMLFFLQPFWSSCITLFRTPVGFFCFLSFSALCRYVLPRLRVVSSVQQWLSVPPLALTRYVVLAAILIFLHHIIQNSCRLFCFLSFSALCRYLLPRLRVVSPVQQLYDPFQHVWSMFLQPFWYFCITFFRTPVGFFVFFVHIFLISLVWLVLLCSRTRCASISLALPWLFAVVLVFLSVCDHIMCISLGWRLSTDTGCTDVVE